MHVDDRNSHEYFGRLKYHLPRVKDPTVVILRGHLLIEELLDELIAANLKDSDAIHDARLTFHQKLCIVQAFIGRVRSGHILEPIFALNKLRNEIGHRLPDATLIKKLDSVLKEFLEDEFDQIPTDVYSKSKALRKSIIFHCAMLHGFISGIVAHRAVKDEHLTTTRNEKLERA